MIDLPKANKEFIKYVKEFDDTNWKIKGKQRHSIRVENISKLIAEDLKLNQEEIDLAMLIGLLHDIGRFEQEKQYHTFNDLKSFDHGDYGAELLKKLIRNFISIDKYDKVIFEALRNHNKLRIDENLNEQERLFAKLVRDADKLDIMDETINLFYKETRDLVNESDISEYTLNFVRNHQPVITPKDVEISRLDGVVRTIAFVFDLNYNKSFQILKEQNYINRIIDKFDYKNEHAKKCIEEVRKIANEYVDEKLKDS